MINKCFISSFVPFPNEFPLSSLAVRLAGEERRANMVVTPTCPIQDTTVSLEGIKSTLSPDSGPAAVRFITSAQWVMGRLSWRT